MDMEVYFMSCNSSQWSLNLNLFSVSFARHCHSPTHNLATWPSVLEFQPALNLSHTTSVWVQSLDGTLQVVGVQGAIQMQFHLSVLI